MAFNTTGESHKNGLKGEGDTKSLIENSCTKLFGNTPTVVRRGGTQYKEDLLINNSYKLSCKNRQSASGSFDYLNSSQLVNLLASQEATKLKKFLKTKKHSYMGRGYNKETLKPVISKERGEFNDLSKDALLSMSSSEIEAIVRKGMEQYIKDPDFYFSITHRPRNELILFPAGELPLIKFLKSQSGLKFSLIGSKRSKSSACIKIEDNTGNIHDFGLRLRLVLNNGVGALLAGKDVSSNNSSQLVLKLQQDQPDKQIDNVLPQFMEIIVF